MFCSAGTSFPDERKRGRKRFALRGGLQVCVSKSCAELARQLSPLYGNTPPARPDWGEGRGVGERFPRGMGTEEKTRLQAEAGKLKQNVCFTESVCLLRRERVWSFAEFYCFSARGGGRTEFSREMRIGKRRFPRARHNESFVSGSREDYPIGFCKTIPARIPP